MFQQLLPIEFGSGNEQTLVWVGVGFFVLFLFSILLELLRRRFNRRREIEAEWELVEDIMRERGLSDEEKDTLRELIREHAPDYPLEAVNERSRFDACIEARMTALAESPEQDTFRDLGLVLREVRARLGLSYPNTGRPMDSTRELALDHTVWLAPAESGAVRGASGRIMAVDEAFFHVAVREDDREEVADLNAGDYARCRVLRSDDARYAFTARLAFRADSPFILSFLHTKQLERLQSRAYFRVAYTDPVELGILSRHSGADEYEVITRIQGKFRNISAGGFAAITEMAPSRDALVRVTMRLPGFPPFDVDVGLVGLHPLRDRRFLVRGEFVNISEEAQDRVARFVLRRQQLLASEGSEAVAEGA